MANPGDTTIVQTFTFEEQNNPNTAYDFPGRRVFQFPDEGVSYQKILMYHTLKCFEDGTAGNLGFPCGEWDYLSYNYLYHPTGELDSVFNTHPQYLFDNSTFQTQWISDQAVADIYQYSQSKIEISEILEQSSFELSTGISESNLITAGGLQGRSQFVWTAEELLSAGFSAGNIHRLSLFSGNQSGFFKHFTIKLRQANITSLTDWVNTGWVTVYSHDTEILSNSEIVFNLVTPFNWDGTSDISIDFSYTDYNGTSAIPLIGSVATGSLGLSYSGSEFSSKFNQRDIILPEVTLMNQISNNITVAFWMYGDPSFQPENGTTFEAINSNNQRVLNSHTPWSNGRVYWDCGWEDGYDRIDKLASEANYEGKWNHWAFTKNASSGSMRIFLNGTQFHSGTGLNNVIEDIVKFSIGGASSWSNFYNGRIDEFTVLNTTLDATNIGTLMRNGVSTNAPFYGNVIIHHNFNDEAGTIEDNVHPENIALCLGSPLGSVISGEEIFNKATQVSWRPQIKLYRGTYSSVASTSVSEDTIQRPLTSLQAFEVDGYNLNVSSTSHHYKGGYSYLYDVSGEKVDSTWIDGSYQINNDTLEYYSEPFEVKERYEIGRYITPYGINLTLGNDGWTWVYDVTDFEPLLHGEVELEAGNWQELLDLKFLFIEGPETREVKRIENIWNGDFGLSNFDNVVTAKEISLEEGETTAKLRTTVTGHGFGFDNNNCGEFCYNTHSVEVNGSEQWSWEIMQDCDMNPLFPQGGTWIYARAGWCPGAPGTTQEFELTPFFQNGNANIDYNITYDPYGNYVTESQVVYYGDIQFSNDAEIEQILSPSNFKINGKLNPLCDEPRVVIRNKGSQPLTSLTITYRVEGGSEQTYEWIGNLGFMEREEVILSYDDQIIWNGENDIQNFIVDISSDQNNSNNHAESKFIRPPKYSYFGLDDNRIIVILKTNSAPQENSWQLLDINDNVVAERIGFTEPNTNYRDTLTLNSGCYRFIVNDADGDGLGFFANSDGNGQLRLDRIQGPDFKNFNIDFGRKIDFAFQWETNLVNVNQMNSKVQAFLFPNPAGDFTTLRLREFANNVRVRIIDSKGSVVDDFFFYRSQPTEDIILNTSRLQSGIFQILIDDGKNVYSMKMMH